MNELLRIKNEVEKCTLCSLYKSRNKVIVGDGNPKAKIFIIGEGPGFEEDRIGKAFVGRSGQLLDKILLACNFNREKHVYISNIVKCRPPGNRKPSNEEQAACLPYLERQINIISPDIIVTLGATAFNALMGKDHRITKERGTWMRYYNYLLMPTYHPSALLRNPSLKKDCWEDFKKIIVKYRELVEPNHECNYI
jgi:uracil-DNA glycosylase family 4